MSLTRLSQESPFAINVRGINRALQNKQLIHMVCLLNMISSSRFVLFYNHNDYFYLIILMDRFLQVVIEDPAVIKKIPSLGAIQE